MKINIGDNLKQLRKERSITQENLAQFLGVSFQAISKWERNEGYPDITLLPSIANFFDITLDELVGMEQIKNNQKIQDLKEILEVNSIEGKISKNILLLREALKTYPNNFELMHQLAHYLGFVQTDDETEKENLAEGIEICERILEFCLDPILCNKARQDLCLMYLKTGQKDKGSDLIHQLPTIWGCQELMLYEFLDGDQQINELQQTLLTLVSALDICVRDLVNSKNLKATNKEKIEMLNKSNQFYKILHEQKDYHHTHVSLAENYRKMSLLALEDEDIESALAYLEKSGEHAITFDTLLSSVPYTSCLLNTLEYNLVDTSKNYKHNWSYLMVNSYLKNSKYDLIRNTPRFINILTKLKKYA